MTLAYWCILAASILPYAFTGIAKFTGPGYSNRRPRDSLEKLEGMRKRAHWAQLNSFESFPMFAAAVIVAHQLDAPQSTIDALAAAYVGLRVLYGVFYLSDKAPLRSATWFASMACMVAMYIAAA